MKQSIQLHLSEIISYRTHNITFFNMGCYIDLHAIQLLSGSIMLFDSVKDGVLKK